jgi:hypothetical protein
MPVDWGGRFFIVNFNFNANAILCLALDAVSYIAAMTLNGNGSR